MCRRSGGCYAGRRESDDLAADHPASMGLQLSFFDNANGNLARATIRLGLEGHFLALRKAPHSSAFQGSCMHEDVIAAAIGSDEAEAFLIVVEFNGTGNHRIFPFQDLDV
jgi:hypothetical protein